MKITLFFALIFSVLGGRIAAQHAVGGKIISEDGTSVSGVIVANLQNKMQVKSDAQGVFSIKAEVGDEIVFASSHYQRLSVIVQTVDFSKNLTIVMQAEFQNIEEVKIGFMPSTDLSKDIQNLDISKREKKMRLSINESIELGLDKSITEPKASIPEMFNIAGIIPGGYVIGDIHNRRDKYHYADWVEKSVGLQYFESMKIPKNNVLDFLLFCFKSFDISKILKYGIYTEGDLSRLKVVMEAKKHKFLKK